MSTFEQAAEGIAWAEAAGGITLERYRRPGFLGGLAVRRLGPGDAANGFGALATPTAPDGPDLARPTGSWGSGCERVREVARVAGRIADPKVLEPVSQLLLDARGTGPTGNPSGDPRTSSFGRLGSTSTRGPRRS